MYIDNRGQRLSRTDGKSKGAVIMNEPWLQKQISLIGHILYVESPQVLIVVLYKPISKFRAFETYKSSALGNTSAAKKSAT